MSVVIETTLGDITVDLFTKTRPRASLNFLKLCKIKYYNYNLFHTISRGFIAQTGDPTGSRNGGESVFGVLEGPLKRYFEAEKTPRIKHTTMGLISFVGSEEQMIGSQFFLTLGEDLSYLDEQHCVFGEVTEGMDVLDLLNEAICDQDNRPYQDVRITHTVVLDDPFPDPNGLICPSRSPSPSAERLQGGRIAPDEDIDETQGKSLQEINEIIADKEAKARAAILEMIGDIPDADMAPPENVLFVCKLNPVTTDDDLEIIFSRFGKIKSCEVIRDRKTAESLQYAFVEFEDEKSCETAYFKMDNVLIDDRRIHVDFSQSVAKIKWHGKGRGVTTYDDKGRSMSDRRNDFGNGRYQRSNEKRNKTDNPQERHRDYDKNDRRDEQRDRNNRNYNKNQESKSSRRRSRSTSRDRQRDYRRESERYRQPNKQRNRSPSREKYATASRSRTSDRRNLERYQEKRHDEREVRKDRHTEIKRRDDRRRSPQKDVRRRSPERDIRRRSPERDVRKTKETKKYDASDDDKISKDKKRKKQKPESSEDSDSSSDDSSSSEDSSDERRKKKKKSSKRKSSKQKKSKKKRSRDSS